MAGLAVDSVDNSPQTATCPRYPQPYDDVLISETLRTLPEDHNKHSLKWYSFWGKPQAGIAQLEERCVANAVVAGSSPAARSIAA